MKRARRHRPQWLLVPAALVALAFGSASADGKITRITSPNKRVPALGQATQKAPCPKGTHVLDGGAFTTGGSSEDEVAESAPYDGRDSNHRPEDGWLGSVNAGAEQAMTVTYAICSDSIGAVYRRQVVGLSTDSAGGPECPAGTNPIGGGVAIAGKSTDLPLVSSFPGQTPFPSWQWAVQNNLHPAVNATGYSICSDSARVHYASHLLDVISPHSQHPTPVPCPAGTRVIGGGGYLSDGFGEIASLHPSDGDDANGRPDDEWTTWFNNQAANDTADGNAVAVCFG